MDWKRVFNFLGKDEKNTEKSLLTFALNIVVERSQTFFHTVNPNRNHVTTHPDIEIFAQFSAKTFIEINRIAKKSHRKCNLAKGFVKISPWKIIISCWFGLNEIFSSMIFLARTIPAYAKAGLCPFMNTKDITHLKMFKTLYTTLWIAT